MPERAPYEVDPAWSPERKEAFALYRDFGAARSLRAVGQALGKSTALIERWSAEDNWTYRVAAWDAEQDRVAREAASEERERVAKMHARAIDSTITVLMQAPLEMARRIEQEGLSVDAETDVYSLTRATEAAAKVLPSLVTASRLVHGMSTQNVDAKHSKLEGASLEELDAALLPYDDGSSDVADRLGLPRGE